MTLKAFQEGLFKARKEKNALPRYIARRFLFSVFERLGLHVVGDHFYEPIPNLKHLRSTYDPSPSPIPGHDLSIQHFEQEHLERLKKYGPEFLSAVSEFGYDDANYYFRGADALSWYCLLRELKPSSVVEVGQGSSTRVAFSALERNARETGQKPKFVSIDPYTRLLGSELKSEQVHFEQWHEPIQKVDAEKLISRCMGNAVLFVDSSHVHKAGSDVEHLMQHIYPRLPVGCVLHVHDIVLPYPWPLEFYTEQKWFWNEQDMLKAWLSFNTAFSVLLPVFTVHKDSTMVKAAVHELLPDQMNRDQGYSFYLKRDC
jgi:hypothetical protein